MMSNVYTVFFICDVYYLSKVSSNEAETADLSVCYSYITRNMNAVESMPHI